MMGSPNIGNGNAILFGTVNYVVVLHSNMGTSINVLPMPRALARTRTKHLRTDAASQRQRASQTIKQIVYFFRIMEL